MPILINDTAPRAQYTATSGQTVFSVPFEFFANSDLKVYRNSTLLTLTTNYTVTGAGVTGGGTLTLVTGATAGDIITIVRDVPVARTSDFPTSGPFNIEALNTDLDRLTAMVQQQEVLDGRSLRLDQFDTPNTLDVLPVKASRVGRVLAFNATTGQPEAGPTLAAVQSVADASADIDTVAGSIANVNTVAGNIANVNTVAGISSNVTTVAGNTSNINTVASDLNEAVSEINTVATSIANVDAVGTNIGNVNTVAGISANVTTVAGNSSNVTTVAGSIASVNTNAANIVAIQNASANASTATTKASEAAASASAAAGSASSATSSASSASSSASSASSSASAATAAKTAAESARDSTLAAFDSFDDRYLGAKTGDPALDNDGNALAAGALYFNSSAGIMKVYTGSAWVAAYVSGADFLPLSGGALSGSVTQTVNSSADALRITQTGTGNAFVVEDSASTDASPFVIDAVGRVIVGNTTALTMAGTTPPVQLQAAGGSAQQALVSWGTNSAHRGDLQFMRSASGVIGTQGAVSSGYDLGALNFYGDDGAAFIQAAQILSEVDSTPGTNDMPGRLTFATTADGASSPTERMRIDSTGAVGIGTTSLGGGFGLRVSKTLNADGGTNIFSSATASSNTPTNMYSIRSTVATASNGGTPYTISNVYGFIAFQGTFNADSTVSSQVGYYASSGMTGATSNIGFRGDLAAGTNRWNFYAGGTADNYFNGNVGIGVTTPTAKLNIVEAGSQDALRVTNTGTGNSFVVEDSANPDASPFVIDAAGKVFAGTTSAITTYDSISSIFSGHDTSVTGGYSAFRWSANAGGTVLTLNKSRGATIGTRGIVGINDTLGTISWTGDDGAAFIQAASINAAIDGTPGTNDMPGRIVLSTTADGAATPTERMRINNAGNVGIGTSAPTSRLHAVGNGVNGEVARIENQTAAAYFIVNQKDSSAVNIERPIFDLRKNNTILFQISADGAAANAGVTYYEALSSTGQHVFFINGIEHLRINASGNVGIGTVAPTQKLDINDDSIRVRTAKTPASATATGTQGQIAWDANYVYVCVATNTWKRTALATW